MTRTGRIVSSKGSSDDVLYSDFDGVDDHRCGHGGGRFRLCRAECRSYRQHPRLLRYLRPSWGEAEIDGSVAASATLSFNGASGEQTDITIGATGSVNGIANYSAVFVGNGTYSIANSAHVSADGVGFDLPMSMSIIRERSSRIPTQPASTPRPTRSPSVASASGSVRNTKGSVFPSFSRATTTTGRLPV
jgi:hypothetical protein